MVSIVTPLFAFTHLLFVAMTFRAYRRNKVGLLLLTCLLHLASVPLIFAWEQLVSMVSIPLIIVSLIGLILEGKEKGP